ncbi:hypothetical protein BJV82DRAFT_545931 [Fennellomyces sp. T-0311]|nr:hypothetical protein BJV82DRAFT_545931 [Fennellomyces sp. T-0311]
MQILRLTLLILVYLTSTVICKGGGGRGGRGGRAGGGSSGGGIGGGFGGGFGGGYGGGSSGSSGGSRGGNPVMTRPGSASIPNVGGYNFPATSRTYTKGGYGGFNAGAPSRQYSTTRYTYTRYNPTYTGGYSSDRRSGWVGLYNPSLVYWSLIPASGYAGYNYAYHRYNQDEGAYYAPELSVSGNNTHNAIIHGTEYTSEENNYRYTFNMTTNYGYPMADHAFIATSDTDAHPADFAFRLAFAHIVEFDDANHNGFYDDNETLISAVSFENATWRPFEISLQQAATNASLTYYEFSTIGQDLTRDNQPFEVQLTWRSTNLQINMTEGVPLQPNSLQYDLKLVSYPMPTNPTHRLAIAQVLTTSPELSVTKDVNFTTPTDVANQIKSNQTYGASLGDYSEARLEYPPSVNITEVGNHPEQAGIPKDTNSASWIWREEISQRQNRLFYVTIPSSEDSSTPLSLSGFAFLDTNVMNAMADEYYPNITPVDGSLAPRTMLRSALATTAFALLTAYILAY